MESTALSIRGEGLGDPKRSPPLFSEDCGGGNQPLESFDLRKLTPLHEVKEMKRMLSKKSHSWWWDSHISRKNSRWLADNLQKMDQSVKEMLKLIEEEGESFAKKAEMYYEKRPELISHVEDFHRMYRALAERYDKVTGDLRKNIESELESQGSGSGLDLISEPPSPPSVHSSELTPEAKKTNSRAAGFDVFLGSGGSSDLSRKSSDGPDGSSSSSSESDSETEFDETKEVTGALQHRIQELEDELHELREKLAMQEDQSFKISSLEEELTAANEKLDIVESGILDLKKKLEESNASLNSTITELNFEKKKVFALEEQIVAFQSEILELQNESEILKLSAETAAKQFEQCKNELVNAEEKFGQEKLILQSGIINLEGANMVIKAEVEKLMHANSSLEVGFQELKDSHTSYIDTILTDKSMLEGEVRNLSQSNALLENKLTMLDNQMRQLEAGRIQECGEKEKQITEINANLEDLKVKFAKLTGEKERLASKVDSLLNDVKFREDQILQMEQHLHQLHLEHRKLITEIEESRSASEELKSRLKELEEKVEMQNAAISDGAELKREAIRQLCSTLEHYRDGYYQLRQLLQGHKRSAVVASR